MAKLSKEQNKRERQRDKEKEKTCLYFNFYLKRNFVDKE